MDVGKRITQLRTERNLTTNKLANLSRISQSYLREVEMGKKNPTVEFLSYICFGLNISLESFFSEEPCEIDPGLMTAVRRLSKEEQIRLAEFLSAVKSK